MRCPEASPCPWNVNAKKAFGAYVGFQRFVASADLEVAEVETDGAKFSSAWSNWCDG